MRIPAQCVGTILLATCFLPIACSQKADPVGHYVMDADKTVDGLIDNLKEHGKYVPGMEGVLKSKLNSASFTIELREDKSFVARDQFSGKRHEYTGTWFSVGEVVSLLQTHEDGEEKDDSMTGTYTGSQMHLVHAENDLEISIYLNKSEAAAPR